MDDIITLSHGSGGSLTNSLINDIFNNAFKNSFLNGNDSAILPISKEKIAFTTDSFVVSPIFFNGGDIGKLSICGTVNDIACMGAKPLYISCGFIIEEGFKISDLKKIVNSMAQALNESGAKIVCGDTKVVPRGMVDKIYINTSGIGEIIYDSSISGENAKTDDVVIITGTIGEHSCAVMLERDFKDFKSDIKSDCAPLFDLVQDILRVSKNVRVLRDPTRGGIATTLNEIANQSGVTIEIDEAKIPISENVLGISKILGIDPLYMACEGRLIIIANEKDSDIILNACQNNKYGKDAKIIGKVLEKSEGELVLKTLTGTKRRLAMPSGINLPRIC